MSDPQLLISMEAISVSEDTGFNIMGIIMEKAKDIAEDKGVTLIDFKIVMEATKQLGLKHFVPHKIQRS